MGVFDKRVRQYAMEAITTAPHPEINRTLCWNLHPHRKPCSACKDICPFADDIFTRPNLVKDWNQCSDCGLCVSVCPSRCIAPSGEQVQHDAGAIDTDEDIIWIGCEKSTRQNTLVRACVGAIPWEAMAYIALNKRVVLDLTPCGECENDACAKLLRDNLTRLLEFFGEKMFTARFTLAYKQKDAPYFNKEVSRREAFSHLTQNSRHGTKQLMSLVPSLRSKDNNWGSALDFRLLLHQRTKQLKAAYETPLHYGFHLPNFTDKCFGCGKCEKACRVGALRLEDMADGTTRVVVTPWKCSECGLCVSACNTHAIDGMKLRQITTLGPVIIHHLKKVPCADCGKPVPPDAPDGICSVCRIKRRTKQRQEEAAERARKRKAEKEAAEAAAAPAEQAADEAQAAPAAVQPADTAPAAAVDTAKTSDAALAENIAETAPAGTPEPAPEMPATENE